MPRYLISFDDGSMDHIPDADMPKPSARRRTPSSGRPRPPGPGSSAVDSLRQQAAIVAVDGTVAAGPVPERKAVVGGFSILEVPSRDDALAGGARAACRRRRVREIMFDPGGPGRAIILRPAQPATSPERRGTMPSCRRAGRPVRRAGRRPGLGRRRLRFVGVTVASRRVGGGPRRGTVAWRRRPWSGRCASADGVRQPTMAGASCTRVSSSSAATMKRAKSMRRVRLLSEHRIADVAAPDRQPSLSPSSGRCARPSTAWARGRSGGRPRPGRRVPAEAQEPRDSSEDRDQGFSLRLYRSCPSRVMCHPAGEDQAGVRPRASSTACAVPDEYCCTPHGTSTVSTPSQPATARATTRGGGGAGGRSRCGRGSGRACRRFAGAAADRDDLVAAVERVLHMYLPSLPEAPTIDAHGVVASAPGGAAAGSGRCQGGDRSRSGLIGPRPLDVLGVEQDRCAVGLQFGVARTFAPAHGANIRRPAWTSRRCTGPWRGRPEFGGVGEACEPSSSVRSASAYRPSAR